MKLGTFSKYRGYIGTIEFEDGVHVGKILDIPEEVTYTASSLKDFYNEYIKAIDQYIDGKKVYPKYSFEIAKQIIFDSIMELFYHSENLTDEQIGNKLYGVLNELEKMKDIR